MKKQVTKFYLKVMLTKEKIKEVINDEDGGLKDFISEWGFVIIVIVMILGYMAFANGVWAKIQTSMNNAIDSLLGNVPNS